MLAHGERESYVYNCDIFKLSKKDRDIIPNDKFCAETSENIKRERRGLLSQLLNIH